MNEKIEQLVKQADLTEIIDDAYLERGDWQPFVDKFAELIVRECAMFGMVITDDHFDVEALYKHFGVKP